MDPKELKAFEARARLILKSVREIKKLKKHLILIKENELGVIFYSIETRNYLIETTESCVIDAYRIYAENRISELESHLKNYRK